MKVRVQVIIESDDGDDRPPEVHEVAHLERADVRIDTLGLQLAEAKDLLQKVQEVVVVEQVRTCLAEQVACPSCGRARRHKDADTIVVRTLFGTCHLRSPRWWQCSCLPHPTRTFSPLAAALPERTTPELLYLESKFAGLVSYGLSAKLLAETLPLGRPLHATAVRLHAQATAERLEDELGPEQPMFIEGCQAEWDELPRPDLPLTVGLDGGYVHSSQQRSRRDGWFEVLKSQGMQPNQQVTFVTDGGDDVRELPLYLNPQAEHLLDWFHITMRLTVLSQMAKGVCSRDNPNLTTELAEELERLKRYLWHGNVFLALQTIRYLQLDLDSAEPSPEQRKLSKAVAEFDGYIRANGAWIPNFGERWRSGETISSAFVESTVNQVVSKRMVKKQQMRWTPRGAHLLLQVRTRVLNDDLATVFQRWYSAFVVAPAESSDTTRAA